VTLTAEGGEIAGRGSVTDNGNFKFPHVRAKGPVTLRATAWEFSDTTMENVALNKKNLKVTLGPAPRLKLKVVDPSGALISPVDVEITTKEADGSTHTTSRSDQRQEATGVLLFVSVGEVSVEVSAEDYETTKAGPWTVKAGQTVDGGTVTLKKGR
jgi:hypothetical protein